LKLEKNTNTKIQQELKNSQEIKNNLEKENKKINLELKNANDINIILNKRSEKTKENLENKVKTLESQLQEQRDELNFAKTSTINFKLTNDNINEVNKSLKIELKK